MDLSMFSLEGRVAIVTGGGMGIGKGIALGFAKAGADILVAELNVSAGETTAQEIGALGRQAMFLPVDVRETEQVENMVSRTMERFGKIDILCNNVGGTGGVRELAMQMSDELWDEVISRNLKSTFLCSRAVSKVMVKQKKGSIINIASGAGLQPYPLNAPYGAAKAGIINFTQTLAIELAPYHIRVNCIAPGITETPATAHWGSGQEQAKRLKIPLGRIGKPEDMAAAAIYLASDASDFVTGVRIEVRGGPIGRASDRALEDMFQLIQKVPG
ncbi:SDR family NAD(P)-dependent oxidoreductase [Chloroflexota bacterium]